jgi:4-carboxymuconolactone decarboxylase
VARVSYLTSEEAKGETARLLGQLEERGVSIHLLQAIAHSSGGARNFSRLGNSLRQYTYLSDRLRELVILWLACRLDSSYEWVQHEKEGRLAGLNDSELEAIRRGDLANPAFTDTDRICVRFAEAVVAHAVTDEIFHSIQESLNTEATVDLVLAAAWWGAMVPAVVGALAIEPE